MAAPWFRRVWTAQELALAKQAWVHCAGYYIRYDVMNLAVEYLSYAERRLTGLRSSANSFRRPKAAMHTHRLAPLAVVADWRTRWAKLQAPFPIPQELHIPLQSLQACGRWQVSIAHIMWLVLTRRKGTGSKGLHFWASRCSSTVFAAPETRLRQVCRPDIYRGIAHSNGDRQYIAAAALGYEPLD